jgi:hypothetical protein
MTKSVTSTVTVTADELEALGYAVDQFTLRAEECAERSAGDPGTVRLISFLTGVAATLEGLQARCTVPSPDESPASGEGAP